MGIEFTEAERSYLFSEINTQYQDYNYRSLEGSLLAGILTKLISTNVDFVEIENRRCQWLIEERIQVLARLTNPRLQHVLVHQNNQGFAGVGEGGGCDHYFNSGLQYNLCQSIKVKLND